MIPASVSRTTVSATSSLRVSTAAGVRRLLQVHQRVGQGDILLTEEFVVLDDMALKLGAILGKVVRRAGPGGKAR